MTDLEQIVDQLEQGQGDGDVIMALRTNAQMADALISRLFGRFGGSSGEDDRIADVLSNLLRDVRASVSAVQVQQILTLAQGNPSPSLGNLLSQCGRVVSLQEVISGCLGSREYREFGLIVLKGVTAEMTTQQEGLYDFKPLLEQAVNCLDEVPPVQYPLCVACVQAILRYDSARNKSYTDFYQKIADAVVAAGIRLLETPEHRSNGIFTLRNFVEQINAKIQWNELVAFLLHKIAAHAAEGYAGPLGESIGEVLKLLIAGISKDLQEQLFAVLPLLAAWNVAGWFARTDHRLAQKHPRHSISQQMRTIVQNLEMVEGRSRVRKFCEWLLTQQSTQPAQAICFIQLTVPSQEIAQLLLSYIYQLAGIQDVDLTDLAEPIILAIRWALGMLLDEPREQGEFTIASALDLAIRVARMCPYDASIDYALYQLMRSAPQKAVFLASNTYAQTVKPEEYGLLATMVFAGVIKCDVPPLQIDFDQLVHQLQQANLNTLMLMSAFPGALCGKFIPLNVALQLATNLYQNNMVEYFGLVLRITFKLNLSSALAIARQVLQDTQGPMRDAVFDFLCEVTISLPDMAEAEVAQFVDVFKFATPTTSQQSFFKAVCTGRLGQQEAFQNILMCISFERISILLETILIGFIDADPDRRAMTANHYPQQIRNKLAMDCIKCLQSYCQEYTGLIQSESEMQDYQEDTAAIQLVLLRYHLISNEE